MKVSYEEKLNAKTPRREGRKEKYI